MNQKPYSKTPAFFRVVTFDSFFEAEALEADSVVSALRADINLDSELDAILAKH